VSLSPVPALYDYMSSMSDYLAPHLEHNILVILNDGSVVSSHFSCDAYIIKEGNSIVNEQVGVNAGVEHGEYHIMGSMCGGDGVGVCLRVEEVTVDPTGRMVTALDGGDPFKHSVPDVFADLGASPLISVLYGIVVGVSWVVLEPVLKERVVR
jgi:hypothetical protein